MLAGLSCVTGCGEQGSKAKQRFTDGGRPEQVFKKVEFESPNDAPDDKLSCV